MAEKIKRCVIISGAPENDVGYYLDYLNEAFVICADSGYSKLLKCNGSADLLIGDFDSSECPKDFKGEIIRLNPRKDDSDTFHCVTEAVKRGYNKIIILGAIGSRLDHTYANILSLVYCFDRGIDCVLINSDNEVSVKSGEFIIKKDNYKNFSMFALFEKCNGLTISGSLYDLKDYELSPDNQLNLSNGFKNDFVKVSIKSGKILLILSND